VPRTHVPPARRRGRPPKYGRPSQAVTVTLPTDVVARLSAIDADLGRAIVAAVEGEVRRRRTAAPAAEVAAYGSHAVIMVTPVRALQRIRGVELIPVGRNRALVSLSHPHAIAQLELDIRDCLESASLVRREREALEGIAAILRQARASRTWSLSERTIIVLEARRRRWRA
jgi:hypothetical protein